MPETALPARTIVAACRWCGQAVYDNEHRYEGQHHWHPACRAEALTELVSLSRWVRP